MPPLFNNIGGLILKVTELLCILCGSYFSSYKLTALNQKFACAIQFHSFLAILNNPN
jgi:hypothetical protein